jgi:SAM-dependent methyltransferase
MNDGPSPEEWQRRYYARTAGAYDERHLGPDREHDFALAVMDGLLPHLGVRSVLDVGSGTGRVVEFLKRRHEELRVMGVEPVAELRAAGHAKGLARHDLIAGDATALPFRAGAFDLVCAYGLLHHVARSSIVVEEMLRVARRAIFVSDSNNFGQGSWPVRRAKQLIDSLGLWSLADLVRTRGKGYSISEGDGLSYSYSVFNDYALIRRRCRAVHVLNTRPGAGVDPYRSASHVALLGVKPVDPDCRVAPPSD